MKEERWWYMLSLVNKWEWYFSVSDTGILGKKKFRVLPTGVEPTIFRLLVRTLYHWATGDSWEQRPLNQVHVPKCLLSSSLLTWIFIYSISSHFINGYITNSHNDQLPVGLIAHVEHCIGIAEVMGSNPVQAWIFFRLSFRNCLSCVYNCDDLSLVHSFCCHRLRLNMLTFTLQPWIYGGSCTLWMCLPSHKQRFLKTRTKKATCWENRPD